MSIFATYITNAGENLCDFKPFVYNSVTEDTDIVQTVFLWELLQ